jgi:hypothetical protein
LRVAQENRFLQPHLVATNTPKHKILGGIAMESGNIAWMLVASAMVLLMTLPALILFYAGMVRAKNVLSIFVQCYVVACLMSVL